MPGVGGELRTADALTQRVHHGPICVVADEGANLVPGT